MIKTTFNHDWDVSPKEAVAIQHSLRERVVIEPLIIEVQLIAGIDVSVKNNRVRTAIVVLDLDNLSQVDSVTWEGPAVFPYVPGLLSFREIPAILPALELLSVTPDAIMLDGQGLAHPRRFGLACHLGVLLDIPSLGVAKSRLTGTYKEPGETKGESSTLTKKDEILGAVLRTRTNVNPVFVSVGHKMELADALKLTLASTGRYRIPEPTRLAHHLSRRGTTAIKS
ncbi:MAG: deoxyribonuclease V [Rhodothermia bacterium]|nr:MAG: deoxyribonuclease V [Rhodothermia bacterium]